MPLISFRFAHHQERLTRDRVVEILIDGAVVAVIYPREPKGIRIMSAHIDGLPENADHPDGVVINSGLGQPIPIPTVDISFNPRPYTIEYGRLRRIKI